MPCRSSRRCPVAAGALNSNSRSAGPDRCKQILRPRAALPAGIDLLEPAPGLAAPADDGRMGGSGCRLAEPIYRQICQDVLEGGYVQIDETPIRYLEPGNGKTKLGYFGPTERPGRCRVPLGDQPGCRLPG